MTTPLQTVLPLLTPAQEIAESLVFALRRQFADNAHTHECNRLRETYKVECCGSCQIARDVLEKIGQMPGMER